jgi:hypothetical protein
MTGVGISTDPSPMLGTPQAQAAYKAWLADLAAEDPRVCPLDVFASVPPPPAGVYSEADLLTKLAALDTLDVPPQGFRLGSLAHRSLCELLPPGLAEQPLTQHDMAVYAWFYWEFFFSLAFWGNRGGVA